MSRDERFVAKKIAGLPTVMEEVGRPLMETGLAARGLGLEVTGDDSQGVYTGRLDRDPFLSRRDGVVDLGDFTGALAARLVSLVQASGIAANLWEKILGGRGVGNAGSLTAMAGKGEQIFEELYGRELRRRLMQQILRPCASALLLYSTSGRMDRDANEAQQRANRAYDRAIERLKSVDEKKARELAEKVRANPIDSSEELLNSLESLPRAFASVLDGADPEMMVTVLGVIKAEGERVAAEQERANRGFAAAKELEALLERVMGAVGNYQMATTESERARRLLGLRLGMRALTYEIMKNAVIKPLAVAQGLVNVGWSELLTMRRGELNDRVGEVAAAVETELPTSRRLKAEN